MKKLLSLTFLSAFAGCVGTVSEKGAVDEVVRRPPERIVPLVGDPCTWAKSFTEPRVYTSPSGMMLNYRFHQPSVVKKGAKYPLVVFLHGAGERGEDNVRQMVHGVPQILDYGQRRGRPFFLVAGQVSGRRHPTDAQGYKWVQIPWGNTVSQAMPDAPSDAMSALIDLLADLRKNPAVDTSRIYVTGISMGGYGTWDLVMRKPDWFAAAMPVCGGGDETKLERLKELPIWIFHGGADTVVPTVRGRRAAEALKALGGHVDYTEYPGVGHDSWTRTYSNDQVLDWLFAQKRK